MRTSLTDVLNSLFKKNNYSLMPAQEAESLAIHQKFYAPNEANFMKVKNAIRSNFQYVYPESNFSPEAHVMLLEFCEKLKELTSQFKKQEKIIYLAALLAGNNIVLADLRQGGIESRALSKDEVSILEECVPIVKTIKEEGVILPITDWVDSTIKVKHAENEMVYDQISLEEYASICEFYHMLKKLTPALHNPWKKILLAAALTGYKKILKSMVDKAPNSLETFFSEEEVTSLEKCLPELGLENSMSTTANDNNKLWFLLSKEKNLLSLVVLHGDPASVQIMIELGVNVNPQAGREMLLTKWVAKLTVTPFMSAILQYERSLKSIGLSGESSVHRIDSCFKIVKILFEAGACVKKDSGLPNQIRVNNQIGSQSVEIQSYCESQNLQPLVQLFRSKNTLNPKTLVSDNNAIKEKANTEELNDNNSVPGFIFGQ